MTDEEWHRLARLHRWTMPPAPRWKRLPIIRHIRTFYHWRRVERARWRAAMNPHDEALSEVSDYDAWVLVGICRGREIAPVHR